MAHKTKAEKIAAALRAKKIQATQTHPSNLPHQPTKYEVNEKVRTETTVYNPRDLLKTFSVTLLILSLMTLFYIAQIKGYVQ